MRMFLLRVLGAVLAVGVVAACSSGVVPMGRDTYMISRKGSSFSTSAGLRAECAREAARFCAKQGLVMVPVASSGRDGGVGIVGSGELTFRAVPAGDAEDKRPSMERAADHYQIIETRAR